MFFFVLIIIFFAVPFGVIQMGILSDHPVLAAEAKKNPNSYPGFEYKHLSYLLGYVLMVFRYSTGDSSNITSAQTLSFSYDAIFWVLWLLIMIFLHLIFLNFVITKAMNVYEHVSERLDEYIIRDRTDMIAEADQMKPKLFKNQNSYSKYFIIREI